MAEGEGEEEEEKEDGKGKEKRKGKRKKNILHVMHYAMIKRHQWFLTIVRWRLCCDIMSHIDIAGVIGPFSQTVAWMATVHSQEVTIDSPAWRGSHPIICRLLAEDTLHDLHAILDKTVRLLIVRAGHLVFDAPLIGDLLELRT